MQLVNLLRKKHRKTLFTTPSHSQEFCIFHKLRNMYLLDVSETETHNPQIALEQSESCIAKIYGTKKTKFLTNGSTSGILAAVLTCVKSDEKVLLWSGAHVCHHNAVKLAGATPVYYDMPIDLNWGVPIGVSAKTLEKELKSQCIKAVIVTSPTYEGFVSNIREIKRLCEKYDAYLIVDEAHGALYPFSDELPESAVKIADFTVQSLHKTAGGLNPTALLHTNTDLDVDMALSLISTTSPSYPILASIEKNVHFLNSVRGRKKIENLIKQIKVLRKNCPQVQFGGDDITKILVRIEGMSAEELSEKLFGVYNIEDERTNLKSTMLLCGIGTSTNALKRLTVALNSLKKDKAAHKPRSVSR